MPCKYVKRILNPGPLIPGTLSHRAGTVGYVCARLGSRTSPLSCKGEENLERECPYYAEYDK